MKLTECKVTGHKFDEYYRAYEREMPENPKRILEIGVQTGDSLLMWKERYPNALVVGVDNDPTCGRPDGIPVVIGDGHDPDTLDAVWQEFGPFDVVIDDGSHNWADQIRTFEHLIPKMSGGSLYVCEDTHTSYWRGFGDGETFIARVRRLLDDLHGYATKSERSLDLRTLPDTTIGSVHAYRGIVFFRILP